MKILVFEYICGGGLCSKPLPRSLVKEGLLMLKTLVNDLNGLNKHSMTVLLDWRLTQPFDSPVNIISVIKKSNVLNLFQLALGNVDAVWLIAPESQQILFKLTQLVELSQAQLLSSPSSSIAQTGDKWQTFQILSSHQILTIPTKLLNQHPRFYSQKTVIKKRDGVGCEGNYIIHSPQSLSAIVPQLHPIENYIVQPFIQGKHLSLSALFKQGKARLLCVNHQHIDIINHRFQLLGCDINHQCELSIFHLLLHQIALAFPELWGYIGIDLIQTPQILYVVEINPRLTSSYVGIKTALNFNVAEAVLRLSHSSLPTIPLSSQSITVTF